MVPPTMVPNPQSTLRFESFVGPGPTPYHTPNGFGNLPNFPTLWGPVLFSPSSSQIVSQVEQLDYAAYTSFAQTASLHGFCLWVWLILAPFGY